MRTAIASGVVVVGLVGFLAVSYISAYNTGNALETGIKAAWTDNQNVLAQVTNRISESAQVPAMQRDDLAEVVERALDARYGDEGSQAMFQWIQEQNPTIDSAVYTQLQRVIEAGRTDFQNAQTKLIDQKRVYETALGSFWQGTMLGIAGFPRVDLEEYNIVTNSRARDAFETGVEEPLQLRP